ncbi:hypothetical protein FIBSPDRAFT_868200 [Athelia psychrophila]|uniref:Uncharacterized protein n=1 Tax=Athelia psychrophila TaxID=1759441 RepID=A0A166DBJ4_9AGAM|nr:hypothetical protein FIBSPDRAFT_868200 [Fibularhizoctonia sp. CBS 109695]
MFAQITTLLALFAVGAAASLQSPGETAKGLKCSGSPRTVYINPQLVSVKLPGGRSVPLGFHGAKNANGSAYWQEYNNPGIVELGMYECASSYMGYISNTDGAIRISNGHIRVIKDGFEAASCLTVDFDASVNSGFITLQPCSMADDASQTRQFWHVEQNEESDFDTPRKGQTPIRFLGNVTYNNGDNEGFYNTEVQKINGTHVVKASFSYGIYNEYQTKLEVFY